MGGGNERWAREIVKREEKNRIILLRRVLKILKLFADDGRNLIPFFIEIVHCYLPFFSSAFSDYFNFNEAPLALVRSFARVFGMMPRLKLFPLLFF